MRILSAYTFKPLLCENSVRAQGSTMCLKLSAYWIIQPNQLTSVTLILHTVLRLHINGDNFSIPHLNKSYENKENFPLAKHKIIVF